MPVTTIEVKLQADRKTIDRTYDPPVVLVIDRDRVQWTCENKFLLFHTKKICPHPKGCTAPEWPFAEPRQMAYTAAGGNTGPFTPVPTALNHVYKCTYEVDTDPEKWDPHIIVIGP